ncbi:hypothetical protein KKH23_06400 [Patescibacteria group bacterium]|uniref:Holin n=1 Tax=viral metagenome TaxID=1070528 RepID=A0A6M3M7J0_9ZZZZ|nr:hypothetical protein [Patescibacteria group bacterium]MBU0846805.1 hypothetical protein [Patescibacteria group bacterium]MBU1067837.1 hypothetical protein [Patescibacteria group bacterium]
METLTLILCSLGGVLIHFAFKFYTSIKLKVKFEWKLPLATAVLSIITNAVLILVREDLIGILPFTKFTAVMYGYLGDSVFRNLIKTQKPNAKPNA